MNRAQRESRLEKQERDHKDMRDRLRETTDNAVARLKALREAHQHHGHFSKGVFIEGRSGK
jgi:hypothetical protein